MNGFKARGALLLILGTSANSVVAQQLFPDTSAAQISILLRTRGYGGRALRLLRQQEGTQLPSKLDAIADSLVAIATSLPGDSIREINIRYAALDILLAAGRTGSGVAYQGAAFRLIRIALSESPVRGGAVYALTRLADQDAALRSLKQVATARASTAYVAIEQLTRNMGPSGLQLARQIYTQDLVRDDRAHDALQRIARYYGW